MAKDAITEGLETVSLVEEPSEEVKQAEIKDKQIAELKNHPGWLEIVERLQDKVHYYRTMQGVDTSGLDLKDIGQKYVVSNLVADEIQGIINLVEQTANEIEKSEESTTNKKQ